MNEKHSITLTHMSIKLR